jgi:hypothetical protein
MNLMLFPVIGQFSIHPSNNDKHPLIGKNELKYFVFREGDSEQKSDSERKYLYQDEKPR